jgi:hypothetical protein
MSPQANRPEGRQQMYQVLQEWRTDECLAGVRDEAELNRLPAAERTEWRKLWADVSALQQRVEPAKKVGPAGSTLEAAPPPRAVIR